MAELDTKLLRVFAEIYETRSISQAAIVLGLSQPTVSIYLAKLREHYHDPLFVRSSRGMEPTPLASGLHDHIATALTSIEAATSYRTSFDPLASDRTFRIAMTDISQIVMLPRLIRHLSEAAPGVSLEISHIAADTRDMFERGEVDIAVGFMPQLDAGFYQQKLFRQHYVCIASSAHGAPADKLTLDYFLHQPHVRVTSSGTGHALVEKLLKEQNYHRTVLIDVPNYLGLLEIVSGTRLIAVVPAGLAAVIGADSRIKVLGLPAEIELPTYLVKQHWHGRNHRDQAHQWLRSVLTDLFLSRRDDLMIPPPLRQAEVSEVK